MKSKVSLFLGLLVICILYRVSVGYSSPNYVGKITLGEKFTVGEYDGGKYMFEITESCAITCNEYLAVYKDDSFISYIGDFTTRLGAGEYYVELRDGGTYIINTEIENPLFTEQEFNNSFDTANIISKNVLYKANINDSLYGMYGDSIDVDYFKFILNKPSMVYVEIPIYGHYIVELFSEDENTGNIKKLTQTYRFYNNIENSEYTPKIGLPAGKYFLKIYAESSTGDYADYTFKVVTNENESGNFETEFNNTSESANLIDCNKEYSGNITVYYTDTYEEREDDIDWYKIRLDNSGYGRLKFKIPRESEQDLFEVKLYNAKDLKNPINTFKTGANPTYFTDERYFSEGEYYVSVEFGWFSHMNTETKNNIKKTLVNYNLSFEYNPIIEVDDITLEIPEGKFYSQDEFVISAKVLPENASTKDIKWSSSDYDVAYVTQEGKVICYKPGKAYISAKCGSIEKSILVVVERKLVENLEIISSSESIYTGERLCLALDIKPINADSKTCIWKSSDNTIATVSQEGVVYAKKAGTVMITATTVDGSNIEKSITLTVNNRLVTNINIVSSKKSIYVGSKLALKLNVEPVNATKKSCLWKTSNSSIATVSQSGVVVAKKAGTVVISVTTKDGSNITKRVTIKVIRRKSANNKLSSLKVSTGKLNRKFVSNVTKYTLTLATNKSRVTIAPIKADKYAKVYINGKLLNKYTLSIARKKSKTVKITVVAENGAKKNYIIIVKRK